jgi:hypothetical protein
MLFTNSGFTIYSGETNHLTGEYLLRCILSFHPSGAVSFVDNGKETYLTKEDVLAAVRCYVKKKDSANAMDNYLKNPGEQEVVGLVENEIGDVIEADDKWYQNYVKECRQEEPEILRKIRDGFGKSFHKQLTEKVKKDFDIDDLYPNNFFYIEELIRFKEPFFCIPTFVKNVLVLFQKYNLYKLKNADKYFSDVLEDPLYNLASDWRGHTNCSNYSNEIRHMGIDEFVQPLSIYKAVYKMLSSYYNFIRFLEVNSETLPFKIKIYDDKSFEWDGSGRKLIV